MQFGNSGVDQEYRNFREGNSPDQHRAGDLSSTADIDVYAGRQTNTDVKGDMKTPGERIYAICCRKIRASCHEGEAMPSLDQTA
jgi:hypothetical protein